MCDVDLAHECHIQIQHLAASWELRWSNAMMESLFWSSSRVKSLIKSTLNNPSLVQYTSNRTGNRISQSSTNFRPSLFFFSKSFNVKITFSMKIEQLWWWTMFEQCFNYTINIKCVSSPCAHYAFFLLRCIRIAIKTHRITIDRLCIIIRTDRHVRELIIRYY